MVCASLNCLNSNTQHKEDWAFFTLGLWQQSEDGVFTGDSFIRVEEEEKQWGKRSPKLALMFFFTLKSNKGNIFYGGPEMRH